MRIAIDIDASGTQIWLGRKRVTIRAAAGRFRDPLAFGRFGLACPSAYTYQGSDVGNIDRPAHPVDSDGADHLVEVYQSAMPGRAFGVNSIPVN
jgi:hypothetical protein